MKWQERTTTEIERDVGPDTVAILPIAAIEQHGPHLPLSTDADIGRGLLDAALGEVGDEVPVLVLPMQSVGASDEHASFAGTVSLGDGVMARVLFQIARSLAGAGVRRLVVSNSHGGNKAALDMAALRIRRRLGMLVVKASYFRFPKPDGLALPHSEWSHGLHGGAIETAMMLHLAPEAVRRDRVRPFTSAGEDLASRLKRVGPEGPAPFAWTAADLNAAGVVGDATLATPELGAELVAHYASILAEVIRDAHAFPLDRLAK